MESSLTRTIGARRLRGRRSRANDRCLTLCVRSGVRLPFLTIFPAALEDDPQPRQLRSLRSPLFHHNREASELHTGFKHGRQRSWTSTYLRRIQRPRRWLPPLRVSPGQVVPYHGLSLRKDGPETSRSIPLQQISHQPKSPKVRQHLC